MPSDTNQPRRGPSDATDYSSTKAPETQVVAEERDGRDPDARLRPGGAHSVPVDPGMSSLQEHTVPSDPHRKP